MKRVGIYVFSGTGNTLKCAGALRDELEKLGADAALFGIEESHDAAAEEDSPDAAAEEAHAEEDLVICYPVYGFNVPAPVLRFCRELPQRTGRVWFLKTSGEPLKLNDNSSAALMRVLRRKGRTVMGEFHYVMPYNMIFRHSDETASLMWKTARERIPAAAAEIMQGTVHRKKAPLPAKILSHLCAVERLFYPLNGRIYRIDRSRCINCMRCAEHCPMGNISFAEGKFRFGWDCAGCMGCAFNCPADAVRIGLLNFMRVNGPYDFGRDPSEASIGKYCRKAYLRYFDEDNAKEEIILKDPAPADAEKIEEYRASFPADRMRVTLNPERIPGLDRLEDFDTVSEWLEYCRTMEGKINWYMSVRTADGKIVGFCCLRRRLEYDDDDPDFASHIGYSIRPDERRKGYGARQLHLVLQKAQALGIDPVRIICRAENTGSIRTILANGGVYVDSLYGEESGLTVNRYDVRTGCKNL